ncbi:MAG: ABC transporter transmembrane domain-containing protein, partial [Solirubrobacteraceae bacterium]
MSAVAEPAPGERLVPSGNRSRYNPPRAWIDPDHDKSWLRRALPIVLARKRTLFSALGLSFVSLMLQVQIPNLLNSAANHSLEPPYATPLSHYVRIVFALAVAAGISSYFARLLLMRTAYGIEADLRNMIYTHLTRMSFGFYDRVQSGQLISRANSDIRSVQMYLTFGPNILVQCSIAVVAFIYMLTIDVPLAFVAMCTLPFVFLMGLRMRRSLFPVSWLIQARLAEIATIVDENINGVRVVKSFVGEQREL